MENNSIIVSINGVSVSNDDLLDRGLAYGHGLFETMCLHEGLIPLLDRHLERLVNDASKLGIDLDLAMVDATISNIKQSLVQQHITSGVIKLIVTAGSGAAGYKTPAIVLPRVIALHFNLNGNHPAQQGINLRQCHYRLPLNPRLAGIKHLNRLDQVLARSEWADDTYADGLMFDQNDCLVETTCANIFLYSTSLGWITPSLQSAGVSGVMRGLLLDEIFPSLAIPVTITEIRADLISQCEALFVCNSVRGITPVIGLLEDNNLKPLAIGSRTKMVQLVLADNYPCFK
jgi:4-amino-4-deoxychorismate lyase